MQLAVKASKQQDREQASEEEQVDLGIESLRLKSYSKKVIRQLRSRGKKAKKTKMNFQQFQKPSMNNC